MADSKGFEGLPVCANFFYAHSTSLILLAYSTWFWRYLLGPSRYQRHVLLLLLQPTGWPETSLRHWQRESRLSEHSDNN